MPLEYDCWHTVIHRGLLTLEKKNEPSTYSTYKVLNKGGHHGRPFLTSICFLFYFHKICAQTTHRHRSYNYSIPFWGIAWTKTESISHKPIWYTLEATCEHTYFNICNYLEICVSYYMSGTLPSTSIQFNLFIDSPNMLAYNHVT